MDYEIISIYPKWKGEHKVGLSCCMLFPEVGFEVRDIQVKLSDHGTGDFVRFPKTRVYDHELGEVVQVSLVATRQGIQWQAWVVEFIRRVREFIASGSVYWPETLPASETAYKRMVYAKRRRPMRRHK